jgi:hypothetical protein
MVDSHTDPRTEDTLAYDLLRTASGGEAEVVGRATFRGGEVSVDGPEAITVAVEELLGRPFVDRVQADERPRGYRRTGRGTVEMLVPGMAEHFVARMRGLWLSYPDGGVVTAAAVSGGSLPALIEPQSTDVGPPVTDSAVRRASLTVADDVLDKRPLVLAHAPDTGLRPRVAPAAGRTDCGWLV